MGVKKKNTTCSERRVKKDRKWKEGDGEEQSWRWLADLSELIESGLNEHSICDQTQEGVIRIEARSE